MQNNMQLPLFIACLFCILGVCVAIGAGGTDMIGGDVQTATASSALQCAAACDNNAACNAWSWDSCSPAPSNCWLKSTATGRSANNCRVAGMKLGEVNADRIGGDMAGMPLQLGSVTASACADRCATTAGCVAWSFDYCGKSSCWLKSSIPTGSSSNTCRVSGIQGINGVDFAGNDISNFDLGAAATATQCSEKCSATSGCGAWAFVAPSASCGSANTCWLKSSAGSSSSNGCRISGSQGGATAAPTAAPTSAPTTKAPTAAPTTTKPSTGSKIGLGWGDWNVDNVNAVAGAGKKATWLYTWSAWNINNNPVEFVPMLWGSNATDWLSAQTSGIFNNAKAALAFNEPDNPGQSNLTPAAAANLWNLYVQPIKARYPSVRLGAPACESNTNGKTWLTNFMTACVGCSIDFIPLHWYGSNPSAFTSYVQQMHTQFNKPIWVTEFACAPYDAGFACDQNSVYSFMGQTTQWLDQQSYVERYAWFGALRSTGDMPDTNRLLTTDGQGITSLGNQYAIVGGHS